MGKRRVRAPVPVTSKGSPTEKSDLKSARMMKTAVFVCLLSIAAGIYVSRRSLEIEKVQGWLSSKSLVDDVVYSKEEVPSSNKWIGKRKRASELTLMDVNESTKKKFLIEDSEVEAKMPYVRFLEGPPMHDRAERAMGARFRNFYRFPLTMWWDNGSERGVYSGVIQGFGFSSTNTYTTHKFIFRNKETDEVVAVLTMNDNEHLMILGPDPSDTETLNSKMYRETLKEQQFMRQYYEKNGIPWLSFYPREKPVLYIYPADFVGQTHKVTSYIGYFDSATSQREEPIEFDIEVVSTRPRVFLIKNLLSKFEAEHIIKMGVGVVRRSSVGSSDSGFESDTRTSENGWLVRKLDPVLDTLYYRFGDILRMSDEQMVDSEDGSIENLQFVRYLRTQKYEPHHDFGNSGHPEQRFSTMLIYLKIPEVGGATSFPKAFNGQGIEVKPSVGDAVLFYNMLPDGNADDLSLHSGTAVHEGVKYVCNLWSWDPKKI